jgi:hypothetical protein
MQQVNAATAQPVPGGDGAASLIDVIWAYFNSHRVWPTYAEVDQQLYRAGRQFEKARSELTPGLISGIDSRGLMLPSPEQRLRLTVGGIATCPNGGDHVGTFMLLTSYAVSLEREWDYAGGEPPRFSLEEARHAIPLRGAHGLTVLRQVLSVIDAEPWSGGHGGDGDDRSFQVSRSIREFAGAKTFPEYWTVRERLTNPNRANVLTPSIPAQMPTPETWPAAVAGDGLRLAVHPLLQDALWLYEHGRMADAADKALKEVEARVDAVSKGAVGLPDGETFGQRRIVAALNPSGPVLDVCHADDGYDAGEQDGMKFFFMGVYSGLRNPIGHRKFRPTDAAEVAEILAVASLCLRRLDTASARLSGGD